MNDTSDEKNKKNKKLRAHYIRDYPISFAVHSIQEKRALFSLQNASYTKHYALQLIDLIRPISKNSLFFFFFCKVWRDCLMVLKKIFRLISSSLLRNKFIPFLCAFSKMHRSISSTIDLFEDLWVFDKWSILSREKGIKRMSFICFWMRVFSLLYDRLTQS